MENNHKRKPKHPLWLALFFPQLPIDRQDAAIRLSAGTGAQTDDADQPRAIVLQEGPRRRVLACNAAAAASGIRAGLALNSAYAIVPDLAVSEFDEDEQTAHLDQLSLWALQYSSRVTAHPPDIIVLEIAASLKLFGGLEPLLGQIVQAAREQGVTLCSAVAPTPAAAILLARAGHIAGQPTEPTDQPADCATSRFASQTMIVRTVSNLPAALADIPVTCLALDDFTLKGLNQSGIRSLSQLQTLAPATLTRRFGHGITTLLYKLDGRLPDPQTPVVVPATFGQTVDLPLETPDTSALAFPLNRLLGALGGFLRNCDLGVRQLDIRLYHHRHPPTTVSLAFLDATTSSTHLYRVANERLGAITLAAPVTRLGLQAVELAGVSREASDLFQQTRSHHASHDASGGADGTANRQVEQVLDRLIARLGREALYTPLIGDDHRPEKAWIAQLPGPHTPPPGWPARPLWLLATPMPAAHPLQIDSLPERIENGWWDSVDVRRDYFIAHDDAGSHYWVFRQRHDVTKLWIHGLFS